MIARAYAFGQRHWLAFLNIAIGLFNISSALDPDGSVPAPVLALLGSASLLIGGWSLGWRVQLDRSDKEFFELCEITHALLNQVHRQMIEIKSGPKTVREQKEANLKTSQEPSNHVD